MAERRSEPEPEHGDREPGEHGSEQQAAVRRHEAAVLSSVRVIGEVFGNFRIVSRLGRGGMGEVYLAEQQSIGTRVAVKLLHPEISADAEHVQRFFNEARAVSRIQHAGIVKIFDVGSHPSGHAYLVMEYLEGESLAARIRRSVRMSPAHIADLGRQIASVLDATHSAGITHRDLKPDNIFIVPDRELASRQRAKVLDFGIAKLTGTLAHASPRTMGTMGTPAYMAPEQWGDASRVDWRADIYSLGCLVFEMACGRPPFVVTTLAEACGKHLTEIPPAASSLVPELPAELDELIACMLEKRPEDRPQSMDVVVKRFEVIAAIVGPPPPMSLAAPNVHPSHPSSPAPVARDGATVGTEAPVRSDPPPLRATRTAPRLPGPRSKWPLAIVALLVLASAAGAAAFFLRARDATPPATPAAGPVVEEPVAAFLCDTPIPLPALSGGSTSEVTLRYGSDLLKESEVTTTLRSTFSVDETAVKESGELTLTIVYTLDWGAMIGDAFTAALIIRKLGVDIESTRQDPGKAAELGAVRWRSDDPSPPAELESLRALIGASITFKLSTRGRILQDNTKVLQDMLRDKKVPADIVDLFTRDEVFRTLFIELPEQPVTIDDRWRAGELLRDLPSRGQIAAPYEFRVAAISGNGKQVVIETRPTLKLDLTGRITVQSKQTAFQMWTVFDVTRGELTSTEARACARMAIELDGKPVRADAVIHTSSTAQPNGVLVTTAAPATTWFPVEPRPVTPAAEVTPSAASIAAVLKRASVSLQRCHKGPAANVSVQLSITALGAVDKAVVIGGADASRSCIRKILESTRFPATSAPTTLTVPLVFTATTAEVEPPAPVSERPDKTENAALDRVMNQQRVEVGTCGRLERDVPSVSVEVQVAADGSIVSVRAFAAHTVRACVERVFKGVTFPPMSKARTVRRTYLLDRPGSVN